MRRLCALLAIALGLGTVPISSSSASTVGGGGTSAPSIDGIVVVNALGRVGVDGMEHLGDGRLGRGPAKVVGVAVTPTGRGYVLVDSTGLIEPFGDAPQLAVPSPTDRAVAVAVTPTGRGLWLALDSGAVIGLGDAPGLGNAPHTAAAFVDMTPTPSARGAWLLREDGTIAELGDAPALGDASTSAAAAVGLATTPTGGGLWVARVDGSVVALGDATGGRDARLPRLPPVVGIAGLGGLGSWAVVDTLGAVEVAGRAGSTALHLPPVVAIASVSDASPVPAPQVGIPDTTKVLSSGSVLATTGDIAGDLAVTTTAGVSSGLRPVSVGDVIAAGLGPATPHGLLRNVTAVRLNADGTATLSTSPATLTDALPAGSIRASDTFDDVDFGAPLPVPLDAKGSVVPTADAPATSARAQQAPEAAAGSGVLADSGLSFKCEPIGKVTVTPTYSLNPDLIMNVEWDSNDDFRVELGATLTGTLSTEVKVEGGASCEAEFALLSRSLGVKVFTIGVFPVVIEPKIAVDAKLSAEVTGESTATAGGSITLGATGVAQRRGGGPVTFTPNPVATVTAQPLVANLGSSGLVSFAPAVPTFSLTFYGILAPEASVVSSIEGKVTVCPQPSVEFTAVLKGEVAFKFSDWFDEAAGTGGLAAAISFPLASPTPLGTITIPVGSLCTELTPPGPDLLQGEIGTPYSVQLTLAGPAGPRIFSVSAGALPPGLAIDAATGLIAGTPAAEGRFEFTVHATGGGGAATRSYRIDVRPAALGITTTSLPDGAVNVAYHVALTATRPSSELMWTMVAGTLPAGISFTALGILEGTPTDAGSFPLALRATHPGSGQTAEKVLTLVVQSGSHISLGETTTLALDNVDVTPDGATTVVLTDNDTSTSEVRSFDAGGTLRLTVDVTAECTGRLSDGSAGSGCVIDRHPDGGFVLGFPRPLEEGGLGAIVRRYDAAGTVLWERMLHEQLGTTGATRYASLQATLAPDGSVGVAGLWNHIGAECPEGGSPRGLLEGATFRVLSPTGAELQTRILDFAVNCNEVATSSSFHMLAARADSSFVVLGYRTRFFDRDGRSFQESETLLLDRGTVTILRSATLNCGTDGSACTGSVSPWPIGLAVVADPSAGERVFVSFWCDTKLGEIVGSTVRTIEGGTSCETVTLLEPGYILSADPLLPGSLVSASGNALSFLLNGAGPTVDRRAGDGAIVANSRHDAADPGACVPGCRWDHLPDRIHRHAKPGRKPGAQDACTRPH